LLLVIESPLLAALFTREMDRLWRGAELGINERLAASWRRIAGAAAVGVSALEMGARRLEWLR